MKTLTIDADKIIDGRVTEGSYAEDESIERVVIPEGVTDIGEVAFYGCAGLREVIFPESLLYIREEAFGEAAVRSVELPEGLLLIAEKAFFLCENLRRIEVPGRSTVIESDAFGCCGSLQEGYIACGYPGGIRHHEELQYTLLLCSCPERHSEAALARAKAFIRQNEALIMEWIIKYNNTAAMSGIARYHMLTGGVSKYVGQANAAGRSEITALLISLSDPSDKGEFDL